MLKRETLCADLAGRSALLPLQWNASMFEWHMRKNSAAFHLDLFMKAVKHTHPGLGGIHYNILLNHNFLVKNGHLIIRPQSQTQTKVESK